MRTLDQYLDLVTQLHRNQPRFIASLSALVQPMAELQASAEGLPQAFDLDLAVGPQLDAVGARVGLSRFIREPLPNMWFSFGYEQKGFGRGFWKGPFEVGSLLERLGDETYRRLIRAKISSNNWDGTIPGAQAIMETILSPQARGELIANQFDLSSPGWNTYGTLDIEPGISDPFGGNNASTLTVTADGNNAAVLVFSEPGRPETLVGLSVWLRRRSGTTGHIRTYGTNEDYPGHLWTLTNEWQFFQTAAQPPYHTDGSDTLEIDVELPAGDAIDIYKPSMFEMGDTAVMVQDEQNMRVTIGISGRWPPLFDLEIFNQELIPISIGGVKQEILVTSADQQPLFGFGINNQFIAGFGAGTWGVSPRYLIDTMVDAPGIVVDQRLRPVQQTATATTGFLPTKLAGLLLWFDADDTSSITLSSGSSVAQWSDKSGNDNHAVQADTARQPTLTVAENGKNLIAFTRMTTGAESLLELSVRFSLGGTNTLVAAIRMGALGGTQRINIFGDSLAPSEYPLEWDSDTIIYREASTTDVDSTSQTLAGRHTIIAPTGSILFDGADVTASTAAGTAGGFIDVMGNGDSGHYSQGEMAEVMVFNRVLNSAEIAQVQSYLKAKWNTP
jgi:hypothetical protein